MEQKRKTLFLVEVAIFSALAFLLDLAASFFSFKIWPQGGSLSIAMVPIFLMAYRWGLKGGLLTGFLLGLLQIALGQAYIIHPVQGALDYFVAFTVVGFAGVFVDSIRKANGEGERTRWMSLIVAGIFLGSALRFIAHFIGGVVFFADSAPAGTPAALFSFLYNGSYMLPNAILCSIIVILVFNASPRLISSPS
ncbi:energy-coupled thiamine transporter ThiT [Neobacillus notoginsengisoli]|uniref:Energy-coupled thiamine transporter ThiT n=1 Tax=Neobacillus notoginsengisoli TaxID=1578198 RepID=A0A417YL25_9BACI|nr:energy-coupled thiamine transporter ThiT [Neobacillus notoginsengisoli]RHW34169.1 energy-coupled thiamine transporter ThiT [Neobacillus notoginsengisoli]